MATSSIIENIKVNNPRVIEEYRAAMEKAASEPIKKNDEKKSGVITDPDRTRSFMEKALKRKGKKH